MCIRDSMKYTFVYDDYGNPVTARTVDPSAETDAKKAMTSKAVYTTGTAEGQYMACLLYTSLLVLQNPLLNTVILSEMPERFHVFSRKLSTLHLRDAAVRC